MCSISWRVWYSWRGKAHTEECMLYFPSLWKMTLTTLHSVYYRPIIAPLNHASTFSLQERSLSSCGELLVLAKESWIWRSSTSKLGLDLAVEIHDNTSATNSSTNIVVCCCTDLEAVENLFLLYSWTRKNWKGAKSDFVRPWSTASAYLNAFMHIHHTNSGSAVNGRPNLLW